MVLRNANSHYGETKLRPDTGVIRFLSLAILVVGIGLLFLGYLSR